MKKITKITTLIVLSVLTVTACAQKPTTNYYISISHEVSDYDSWKNIFDKFNNDRMEAGIVDLFVKKNINNTNSVTVFSKVKDLNKAKAFMASATLQEAMKKAGVISAPVIVYYKSALEYEKIHSSSLVTTITHSVADFTAWKETYESAQEVRKNAEISDHLVLRSLSNENVITVLGTATSAAKFNEFMSNPDLKEIMEKAGVTSKPEVEVLL